MTRRQRFRRIPPSLWLFPVLVLVVAGVLTGLNLNGSSIGMLSGAGADDPSLVAGTPRPVRSDEWQVATPVQVGNVHKGFPVHAWLGLTDTDFRVTSLNPPTASWLAIFEPHTWPEFILPADRGFDARWWSYLVVPLIGVFALLMALRVSTSVSIALAFVVALSPLGAWWTSPPPGLIVGYLCGAGTAFLLGAGAKKPIQRLAGGAVAGALVCAAFLVLYPPWFVAAGLVVAAVVAGTLRDRGTRFGLCLGALLVMVVIAGSVMAGWAYQSKAALAAVVGTYYPGQRVSEAGQGLASVLFSAPLNWSMSVPDVAFRSDLTMSQSEAAAPWLPIPVVVVLIAMLLAAAVSARRRARSLERVDYRESAALTLTEPPPERRTVAVIAVSAVVVLELAWALIPLPGIVGTLTLLNRVPGIRCSVGIGLGVALLMGLVAGQLKWRWRSWGALSLAIALGLCVILTAWSASALLDVQTVWAPTAIPVALVVAGCLAALAFPLPRVANVAVAVALVAVVAVNWAIVNPVYRGLGVLQSGPLADEIRSLAQVEGPTRWVSLAGDAPTSVIAASPSAVLSGVTYYPTPDVWEKLAPTQKDQWNNYSKYIWQQRSTASPAVITQVHGTLHVLEINVCSPEVDFLDIRYVVSETGDALPACLVKVASFTDLGQALTVSRRVSPAGESAGAP